MHYISIITNASIIEISETKLGETILSSELELHGYDLVRLDRSRKSGGVACYIKSLIAYSYKVFLLTFFCLNLSQSYWISYVDNPISTFVKHTNNVFTETGVLDKQEYYLLGGKTYRTNGQKLPPVAKGYLDFWFSFSLV